MADFRSWSHAALIRFAEDAAVRLQQNEDFIAQLNVSLNRLEVAITLAQSVSLDTMSHANPTAVDIRLP